MLYVRLYPKTILYFKDNFWVFQPKIHTGILKTFLSGEKSFACIRVRKIERGPPPPPPLSISLAVKKRRPERFLEYYIYRDLLNCFV